MALHWRFLGGPYFAVTAAPTGNSPPPKSALCAPRRCRVRVRPPWGLLEQGMGALLLLPWQKKLFILMVKRLKKKRGCFRSTTNNSNNNNRQEQQQQQLVKGSAGNYLGE